MSSTHIMNPDDIPTCSKNLRQTNQKYVALPATAAAPEKFTTTVNEVAGPVVSAVTAAVATNSVPEKAIEPVAMPPTPRPPIPRIIKHKLRSVWTMWYLEHDKSKTWDEMQNEIVSFDTVEDFWLLYNRIKPPASLKVGSDYSLFRKGIRPMWEDPGNKNGGRWIVTLNRTSNDILNYLWLNLMLIIIGEKFAYSDEICGVVVNVRPKIHKISIWTKRCNNKHEILSIGGFIRDSLSLGVNNIQFHVHVDTMSRHGSNVRPVFII